MHQVWRSRDVGRWLLFGTFPRFERRIAPFIQGCRAYIPLGARCPGITPPLFVALWIDYGSRTMFRTMEASTANPWPTWVCPVHRLPLTEASGLVCAKGCEYDVRDEIPRFVGKSSYADAFGVQWRTFRRTQLDSYTGLELSTARARRCLGEGLWDNLEGATVLECGCGAGRFTEVLLARGARVVSIDLSEAVDANQENCPQSGSHRIAQAHLSQLPFEPRQFDIVFCLGVIQHTPNPEESIARLYEQVRPGGTLVIDHYTHSLSYYTKTTALVRRADRTPLGEPCLADPDLLRNDFKLEPGAPARVGGAGYT